MKKIYFFKTFLLLSFFLQPLFSNAQKITISQYTWQDYAFSICDNGDLMTWGNNDYGQLGIGSTTSVTSPVPVPGMSNVAAVVPCTTSVAALKRDGTVWAWGKNMYGQLGNGNNIDSNSPVQVSTLNGVVAIAGNEFSSFALKSNGTVWGWGSNGYSVLGDGTSINRNVPVQVSGLTGITSIYGNVAGYYMFALKNDGTVWVWGSNADGVYGNGTTTNGTVPVQVPSLTGIVTISSLYNYVLALKNDGTVWSWGMNMFGQLGNGTTVTSYSPVQVSGLTGVTAIQVSSNTSTALKGDGTVWAWGYGANGELGNGGNTNSSVPVQVSVLTDVSQIFKNYLALKNDGTLWSWGWNMYGENGNGTTTPSNVPSQISGLSNITSVFAGEMNAFAVKQDGTLYAWGDNQWGIIGDGTTTNRLTPSAVVMGCPVTTPGCIANYTTTYNTPLNTFTIDVDSATTAIATSYHWNFGDGTTSTSATPSHVYAVDGLYNVCMTSYMASGDSCSFCHIIGKDGSGNIILTGGFTLNITNANTATGISSSEETAIKIYPNPANGIFTVNCDHAVKLEVFNALGENVYSATELNSRSSVNIDLSGSAKGIYFVKMNDGKRDYFKKVVVQ